MIDVNTIKDRVMRFSDKAQNWIYRKVFSSVDVPENLEFLYDVSVVRRRYLTAGMLLVVKFVYRIESSIATLFGGK